MGQVKWTYRGPVGFKMYGEKTDESINIHIKDSVIASVICNEDDSMGCAIFFIKNVINNQLDDEDHVDFIDRLIIDETNLKRIKLNRVKRYYKFCCIVPIITEERTASSADTPIYNFVDDSFKQYVIEVTVNDGSLTDSEIRRLAFNKFVNKMSSSIVYCYCQSIQSNAYSAYHACFAYDKFKEINENEIAGYKEKVECGAWTKIEVEV